MIPDVFSDLTDIAGVDDFAFQTGRLVMSWKEAGVGLEAVEPILRFMEGHPDIDLGTPGELVHFVETFYRKGYETKLVESVRRKPVSHTLWMLNRVINDSTGDERTRYVDEMREARGRADEECRSEIDHFLERLG